MRGNKNAYEMDMHCPHCSMKHDASSQLGKGDHRGPSNGDYALCINCGEWGVYDGTPPTNIRVPHKNEWLHIGTNPDCQRARRAWVATMRQRL